MQTLVLVFFGSVSQLSLCKIICVMDLTTGTLSEAETILFTAAPLILGEIEDVVSELSSITFRGCRFKEHKA